MIKRNDGYEMYEMIMKKNCEGINNDINQWWWRRYEMDDDNWAIMNDMKVTVYYWS